MSRVQAEVQQRDLQIAQLHTSLAEARVELARAQAQMALQEAQPLGGAVGPARHRPRRLTAPTSGLAAAFGRLGLAPNPAAPAAAAAPAGNPNVDAVLATNGPGYGLGGLPPTGREAKKEDKQ